MIYKPFPVFLVALLLSCCAYAQINVTIQNTCSNLNGKTIVGYEADENVTSIVEEILSLAGSKPNVGTFASTQIDQVVYSEGADGPLLVYNTSLFKAESESQKDWVGILAICLEVFPAFAINEMRNQWDCDAMTNEADRFAGHILYQMEASLEEVKSAMGVIGSNPSTVASLSINDRLKALEDGWKVTKTQMDEQASFASLPNTEIPTAPEVSNPKVIRNNHHLILKRSDYPILKESWNSGFKVSESIYQNEQWYVVMTPKSEDFLSQTMRLRSTWPETDIKEQWDKQFDITRVEYYGNIWFLCMTKTNKTVVQRWRTRVEFPEKEIAKNWNEGYCIVEMSYGEGLYALILDKKPSDYKTQTWYLRDNFPEKEINDHWAKGEQITTLKYLNGEWLLVMTKFTSPKKQKWFTTRTFPSEIIETYDKKGYQIRGLAHGASQWVLVMEEI